MFERRKHRRRIAARCDRKPCGDERVFDLKLADQRQLHVKIFPAMPDAQRLRKAVDDGFDEANAVALAADADDRQAARLGGGDDRIRMFVIDVDDRHAAGRR